MSTRSLVFIPAPHLSLFASTSRPTRLPITFNDSRPRVEEVPDSVEPILPALPDDDESTARSVIESAPSAVPVDLLHPATVTLAANNGDGEGIERRAAKRVRIRSPCLVIETPTRNHPLPVAQPLPAGKAGEEDDADKSRVVLGDVEDESLAYSSDPSKPPPQEESMLQNDSFDAASPDQSRVNLGVDHNSSVAEGIREGEESTCVLDRSLLLGIPAIVAPSFPPGSAEGRVAVPEEESSNSASASSLQIRQPIAGSKPAATAAAGAAGGGTTCRFTFFSRNRRSSTSFNATAAVASTTTDSTESMLAVPALKEPTLPQQVAAETSIRQTLPTMNAYNASLPLSFNTNSISAGGSESLLGGQSILPPPTLSFTLSSITPVSRILSHPHHFLPSSTSVAFPRSAPGAVTNKVNLLVVIKEVGEVSRVRSKFTTHLQTNKTFEGRGETRGRMSKAFTEAMNSSTTTAGAAALVAGDGKTERMELVVMDGRMSNIRRLLPSSSPAEEFKVIEEVAEKCFFKLVLWGEIALTSSEFRPGDVIFLQNVSLTRSNPNPNPINTDQSVIKRSRLGTGFPPRDSHQQEKLTLIGNASANNNSKIQLCYRTNIMNREEDERFNFDPEIAKFDLVRRRIVELSRLWSVSAEGRY